MFPVPNTGPASRWTELTDAAEWSGAAWARLLRAAAPAVSQIAELVRTAGYLPDQEVMTHGDIDQKNLIASAPGPVLCDWDLAVPLVPRRELADVALSLACWDDTRIAREVVRAYRRAGGDDTPPAERTGRPGPASRSPPRLSPRPAAGPVGGTQRR